MNFEFEELARQIILAGGIAGALTAMIIFAQRSIKNLRKGWRKVHYIADRIEAMADIAEAQLKANGGSSLLDKVNRIQPNHIAAETHWKELEIRAVGIDANLQAHRKEVAKRLDDGDDRMDRMEELLQELSKK